MRIENWCGYNIRFIEINGEWWAILKDICDALGLRTDAIAKRLSPNMLERVLVDATSISLRDPKSNPSSNGDRYERQSAELIRHPGENKTRWMLAVNETGIYEALFASRKLEARKFRIWAGSIMSKLRKNVGLQGYEVMRMTEPKIQDEIDHILDTIFYDEATGKLMQSVTVQGGDVDQIPFE